jgi:hypothetical protein
MCSLPADTRLDAIVSEAVAKYGQYTGDVVGLGHGRVDRVFEVEVAALDGFKHTYTRQPMINAYKIHEGTKVRCFVYVVPVEVREGREQRMLVGRDGEDLDIATFFRPVGLDAPTGDVYVAMPTQAFAGDGGEVQYAFRVRNCVQLDDGALVPLDDLQIGMEFRSATQRKHENRGVMLIKNGQMFSFQLGEAGDKQSGFRMQYVAQDKMADEAPEHSKAALYLQAFGFVASPPTPEEILARAIQRHFHFYARREVMRGGATRSGATRGGPTRGSSLSHAKLVAGESTARNVFVSQAVPIAERVKVELCVMVGDVLRVEHEKHVEAAVGAAVVAKPAANVVDEKYDGFVESMRCISRMLRDSYDGEKRRQLRQLSEDLCCWPVSGTETTALAVGVIECADQHDEEGQGLHMTSGGLGQRVYTVEVGTLVRVRVTNFSLTGASIEFQPVYYRAVPVAGRVEHREEPEAKVTLSAGDVYNLPFPLQKEAGEDVDGWLLKDSKGVTVLQILFVLSAQSLSAFREEREREERAKLAREREERECAMIVESAPDAPVGEAMIQECCVCLEKKLVRQFVCNVPCGHCVCCNDCFDKQKAMDSAAGKRTRCMKCRTYVADVMRVYF